MRRSCAHRLPPTIPVLWAHHRHKPTDPSSERRLEHEQTYEYVLSSAMRLKMKDDARVSPRQGPPEQQMPQGRPSFRRRGSVVPGLRRVHRPSDVLRTPSKRGARTNGRGDRMRPSVLWIRRQHLRPVRRPIERCAHEQTVWQRECRVLACAFFCALTGSSAESSGNRAGARGWRPLQHQRLHPTPHVFAERLCGVPPTSERKAFLPVLVCSITSVRSPSAVQISQSA